MVGIGSSSYSSHSFVNNNLLFETPKLLQSVSDFNELIGDGKTLIPFYVHKMWGLGTPEDLKYYLENGDKV